MQVKPRLIESGLAAKPEFQNLPERFKELMSTDREDINMRLPIVGYCGHRKGEKSENMFAKRNVICAESEISSLTEKAFSL